IQDFFSTDYRISPQSERMGYRLQGAQLTLIDPKQVLSDVTGFGTVQVPPDGQPIVLMADRQTTGGYVKVAHVASVDLPGIAQRMPGDILRFAEISVSDAQQLDHQREDAFGRLQQALEPLRQLLA